METMTKKMKPQRLFAVVFLLSFTQANEMTVRVSNVCNDWQSIAIIDK